MEIGHVIAELRNEKKISQKDLAKELKVSSSLIALWETNKRNPTLDSIILLVDYFKISADRLIDADRKLTPEQYASPICKMPQDVQKVVDTFVLLDDDNKDILIGEAKKLLKQQQLEEKREISSPTAKAT